MKKKLVILGAGESGIGAAILAKSKGFDVFVSDGGEIKAIHQEVLNKEKIKFESGKHTIELILTASEVIKSPGIPEKAEIVQAIRAKGINIIGEIEFASRYTKAKIVAITGSNGKTTTTILVSHLLKTAGLNVQMGGNVGTSFARLVAEKDLGDDPIFVLELSSFQLDDCQKFRPDVAILLNITPDHLDRYNYEFKNYVASKFRISMNQKASNALIFNGLDAAVTRFLKENPVKTRKQKVGKGFFKKGNLVVGDLEFPMEKSALKGQHNMFNAACAVRAAMIFGIEKSAIQLGLDTFETPPHRLEFVRKFDEVDYINDSKATNVDAVWYALDAMTKKIVWIVGGTDKGNDYAPLFSLVKKKVRAIVFLGVDNTKLQTVFNNFNKKIVEAKSAKEAVLAAKKLAKKDDVVLLSPACASFDLFKNYEDRGAQFRENVLLLK
jgi:UDP-N-acetylmuramoylalanine--D-glutamate ligase